MLVKKISYTDFNGVKREEDHYFNLSKTELAEMELTTSGGLENMVKKIVDAEDMPSIIALFKQIILKAYGFKSDDGKRFIKTAVDGHAFADDFKESAAYDALFMELATNADSAAAFINGIVPSELASQANITSIEEAKAAIADKSGN